MIQVKPFNRIRFGRVEHVNEHERGNPSRFEHSKPKGNETPNRTPEQHERMMKRFGKR